LLGRGRNDVDADAKIFPSAHVRSYSNKTFCDSDKHCSMDATVMLLYVEYRK